MANAEVIKRQIAEEAAAAGAADLIPLLFAIAQQESRFDPAAVGDSGNSVGLYQENINGRGHGLSAAQRSDVAASTRRAIAEIRTTQAANPKADPGTIAILAQRPAEGVRSSYRANINKAVQSPENTSVTYQTRGQSTPRSTVTVSGRRPPSAVAQAAAARAVDIARSQGRPTGVETAGAAQGRLANQAGAARAANIAFNGTYVMPVDGTVTNPWGGPQAYSSGKKGDIGNFNNGADIGAAAGTVVRAPVGGTIISVYNSKLDDRKGERDADENSGWGGSIAIRGDDGKVHHLSHAQFGSIIVQQGQRVEAGQPTHKVGMTGNATGPHVDWEKWDKAVGQGKSENALAAPVMPAASGAKVYAEALKRQQALSATAASKNVPESAQSGTSTATETAGSATGATGDTSVATGTNDQAIATLQAREKELRANLERNKGAINAYDMLLAIPDNRAAFPSQQAYNDFITQRSEAKRQKEALTKENTDIEADLQATITNTAAAQKSGADKAMTADEVANLQARTEQTRAETAALRAKVANGGVSDIERRQIEAQIATNEAKLAQDDARIQLEASRNPSVIRNTNAQASSQEWDVAQGQAMLPYSIDRVIAQTDVDDATAMRIRELIGPEVEKMWTDIWRTQQLTPVEIAEGRANADLTRQRADEIRQTMGPNIRALLARAGVDEANITKITQMLPLEMADLRSTTELRQAQTGKTNQETRLTQLQADSEGEKQRRWAAIEAQIRDNPNMTTDQVNKLVMGAATNIQDWATAYRTQLESQVAQNTQAQRTQELGITQQRADTERLTGVENAATAAEVARTGQVNAMTSSLGEAQGPLRRTAQLAAAAPLVGVQGLRDMAGASRWGTQELNPVAAAFQQFQDRLGALRGQGGTIRNAPTVTAQPNIDIGFTPPRMSSFGVPGANASGVAPGPTSSTAAINAANTASITAPIDPNFSIPGSDSSNAMTEEQRRALGIRRVGGV